jgi:hypothetical protein
MATDVREDENLVEHMKKYFKKAQNSEVLRCEGHRAEWLSCDGDKCPICTEEEQSFIEEMKNRKAKEEMEQ